MRNFFYSLVGFMLVVSCQKKLNNVKGANTRLDTLISKAKNHYVNHDSLKNYLSESLTILSSFQNDSLKRYYLNQVSNQYFNKGFMQEYLQVCKFNLELATEAKDSALIPLIHYDLTDYYFYYDQYDTAYFHINEAVKILKNKENTWLLGRSYFNKAAISLSQNSSIEAEIDAVKALKIAETIDDKRLIYDAYRLLGGIFNNLKNFKKSEEYYLKALNSLKNLKEDPQYILLESATYNNLGDLFKRQKKHDEALAYFQKGLELDGLKIEYLLQYAIMFDNINHTKLKLGMPVSLSDFEYALKIRDSLNLKEGVSYSKIHIGDFYLAKQDTTNAIINYKEALDLANEIQKHEDVLRVLNVLATIEPAKSESYLKRQIFLTDSLNTAERNIRNKFTRIEYETDLIEEEKKVLEKQNKWILIISIILFAFGIL
uniref:tetratricopeptide repeat protein n=1 Tax=Flavobacterium sp. TaxID=239 RepID=UPI0040498BE6